jgi:hypothetical protein
MEIELSGMVRGEQVVVRWRDGEIVGSTELLQRLTPLVEEGRCVPDDLTSVIRCVEMVAGQRMRLRVLDERSVGRSTTISAA